MTSKKNKRFAFYVTGGAGRLIKLLENRSEIIEKTFLVVNDESPNPKLTELLEKYKIKYFEFNYSEKKLKGNERNLHTSDLLLEKFKENNIDYSFCFGGKILKGELLNTYKNRIINFHPSLLPMFPGVKAIDQALKSNSFLLGNTAHFIDEGIDTGPVIMQSTMPSSEFSNYDDVLDLQLPMINQIFSWIMEDRISVENNKVIIKNTKNNEAAFYPNLEI